MAVRTRGIRPMTLGRRLVDCIDELAAESDGEVTGRYEFRINPDDGAELADSLPLLLTELSGVVSRHVAFEGYRLTDEPEIRVRVDDTIRRGDCAVERMSVVVGREPEHRTPGSVSVHRTNSWRFITDDGIRYSLEGEVVTIGRQASCSIAISNPNLSRLHAELRNDGTRWSIEDRGSTNGTRVNDELIVLPTPLEDGDTVHLGSLRLRIERIG